MPYGLVGAGIGHRRLVLSISHFHHGSDFVFLTLILSSNLGGSHTNRLCAPIAIHSHDCLIARAIHRARAARRKIPDNAIAIDPPDVKDLDFADGIDESDRRFRAERQKGRLGAHLKESFIEQNVKSTPFLDLSDCKKAIGSHGLLR